MSKRICVMQDDLKDCGVSSLLMIIKYYHGDVPKEYLRELTKTTKDGVSAFYLVKAAQELGFSTKSVKGDINLLMKDDFPVIAHTIINKSYQHFVVVYEIKNDKVIIADPSKGIRKLSRLEWNDISTQKYFIFKPIKRIPKFSNNRKIVDMLFSFIKEYRSLFIIIIIISLIFTILNIITSYSFKLLMDEIGIYNRDNLKLMLIVLIAFGLIKNLANLFRNKLINYINHNLDKTLVNDVYSHIIYLPYLYYKTRTCGDIITRINDISNIKDLIGRIFLTVFVDLILMIFVLIMLFNINIKLTIIVIGVAIVYCIIILIYNKIIHRYIRESYDESSMVNSYLVETINSIDTIKGLNIEEKVCTKLNFKYNRLINLNKKISNILYNEEFFKESIYYLGNLFVLYLGIIMVIDNKMSLTTLFTYINLFAYYLEPIRNIMDLSFTFKTSVLSIKRIMELYSVSAEKFSISEKSIKHHLLGNLRFVNLSYSYNGINNVLEGINIEIPAGNKVLISGDSGHGKSTLVKLLMKYINDYQGKIYIDNRELNNYELSDIRERICYVSQNEILFTDSIYNNIVLDREVSYDDFLYVSKIMKVNDIVEKLPLKYDTLIEENGFNLSGGERQRIILARTLLKEADIYIFDESLNAIDIRRERIILKNIFKLLSKKTVIVISHRFNNEDLFNQKIKLGDCNES